MISLNLTFSRLVRNFFLLAVTLIAMADPLSITGVAVGLVSLGLEVCQGLTEYYESWKTHDDDIRRALEKIDSLSSTLRALEGILNQPDVSSLSTAHNAQSIMVSVRTGIKAAQDILDK